MVEIKSIGVVGGGQMGSGIAQLAAANGLDVIVHDSDSTALNKALKSISDNIRRLVSRGHLSKDKGADAFRRLKGASNLEDFHRVDIVIEAIVESEDVKKKLFAHLDKIVKGSAILASNTSSISITRFGKTIICSQDFPGFIVNRILMPMINEAFHALYTGVATKEDIDTGMKLGTNHPMGPLELADFIGLDVCLSIMKVLHAGLGDSKYVPCPLLVQYVDAGRLGKKRGIGVYNYSKTTKEMKPLARL
ncbi:uncharacterized protein LOC111394734 isoform X2 [Olea europaea var. sylvestris]|uniref:uncharacterized protein LOC111394734 isoform X2 n=1 Tax=Olea europaea var. sylvestris TaxID=158386 RepID=UPI000C1CCEF1|nr:uncharacterized protein LOC111394734 isoform X2 [Olea europaea var. sylvestris]